MTDESFIQRGIRLDSLEPPKKIIKWLRRLQKEFYCNMPSMPKAECHCIGWDYDHPLYRFYLCPDCKPKWYLAYKELFGSGERKDSR